MSDRSHGKRICAGLHGQALAEYGILLSSVAVAALLAVTAFGMRVAGHFRRSTASLNSGTGQGQPAGDEQGGGLPQASPSGGPGGPGPNADPPFTVQPAPRPTRPASPGQPPAPPADGQPNGDERMLLALAKLIGAGTTAAAGAEVDKTFEILVELNKAIKGGDVRDIVSALLRLPEGALSLLPEEMRDAIAKKMGVDVGKLTEAFSNLSKIAKLVTELNTNPNLKPEERAAMRAELVQNVLKLAANGFQSFPKDVQKKLLGPVAPFFEVGVDTLVDAVPVIEKLSRFHELTTEDKLKLIADAGRTLGPDVLGLLVTAATKSDRAGKVAQKLAQAGTEALQGQFDKQEALVNELNQAMKDAVANDNRFRSQTEERFKRLGVDATTARTLARAQTLVANTTPASAATPGTAPILKEIAALQEAGRTEEARRLATEFPAARQRVLDTLRSQGLDTGAIGTGVPTEGGTLFGDFSSLPAVRFPTDPAEAGARAESLSRTSRGLRNLLAGGTLSETERKVAEAYVADLQKTMGTLQRIAGVR